MIVYVWQIWMIIGESSFPSLQTQESSYTISRLNMPGDQWIRGITIKNMKINPLSKINWLAYLNLMWPNMDNQWYSGGVLRVVFLQEGIPIPSRLGAPSGSRFIKIQDLTLSETNSSHLPESHPKSKQSSSNHQFLGVNSLLVSGTVNDLQILTMTFPSPWCKEGSPIASSSRCQCVSGSPGSWSLGAGNYK